MLPNVNRERFSNYDCVRGERGQNPNRFILVLPNRVAHLENILRFDLVNTCLSLVPEATSETNEHLMAQYSSIWQLLKELQELPGGTGVAIHTCWLWETVEAMFHFAEGV